jgi:hypothetical protein
MDYANYVKGKYMQMALKGKDSHSGKNGNPQSLQLNAYSL